MSQLGSMFLAGINQGSDVAARAQQLRLADAEMQRRQREDELRAEDARRQLLEEDAAREFWGNQLRQFSGPDPAAQPDAAMGPQTSIPQPPSPFARMLGNPHVPAADLRYAYQHGVRLQEEQNQIARQNAEVQQFRQQVDRYADMISREFPKEAAAFRAEAYAMNRWPSNASRPMGVVEPGVYEQMLSTDPAVKAQGFAEINRVTGQHRVPTMPAPAGGKGANPAEMQMREAMIGELSKTPAWQTADPATQLILAHRIRSGFSVSPRDLAMDGVDAKYVHAGAEAAAQVEYQALKTDRDDARKLFNNAVAAEKKATKGDKAAAQQAVQLAQARLISSNTAFIEAQKRLTELQQERAKVVQQAPAAPAAETGPMQLNESLMDQIDSEMPAASPEEKAAEYRRRSQKQ